MYRVEQKKWSYVERKFLPGCIQPKPATPGWCLAKQFLFSAQLCIYPAHVRVAREFDGEEECKGA